MVKHSTVVLSFLWARKEIEIWSSEHIYDHYKGLFDIELAYKLALQSYLYFQNSFL